MLAIYRREIRSYFMNPIGYVYLGVFLTFSALLCSYTTLVAGSYDTSGYFTFLVFSFIILIPILTMRLFAEERKLKTEQLLLTAPVSITGMVLGKYFAALTVFVGGVLASCVNFIPLYAIADKERAGTEYTLKHIGPVTGQIVGNLIAILLLGAALIAVGTLISSLTENQLSAAVASVGVIAFMVMVGLFTQLNDSDGQPLIGSVVIRTVLNWISVLSRFSGFSNGYFDYASLLYYLSITFVFLFLTVRVYEKRRWG